jgi:hypothetical protein
MTTVAEGKYWRCKTILRSRTTINLLSFGGHGNLAVIKEKLSRMDPFGTAKQSDRNSNSQPSRRPGR